MRIIHTADSTPSDLKSQSERDWVYNGLDCIVTREVFDSCAPQLNNQTGSTYAFSKAMQGPALEMRLRGVKVDLARKAEVIDEFYEHLEVLERNLERIVLEGVGMPHFNWRSHPDRHKLFYEKLGIPTIRKGGKPTTDRDALEKMEQYIIARPIVRHLQVMGDLGKKIGVLKTAIDPDGRIRTSYNIAGTNTGRFSSSFSEFGTGGNLQNVEESLRSIFISDPGMKMAKFDAKSGESFLVGAIEWNLFNDETYLSACESGDPHTAVARICWPELPWTGDFKQDKDIAEVPYYRHYSYRFMCKKLGHGSNYGGKAPTLSQQSKLPLAVVEQFQPKYFRAFPAHIQWQNWVDDQLRKVGKLTTLTGRERQFWGRRNDESTLREAIAYDPQGSLADVVNSAMLNIFRHRDAELMMHDHDALTIQYPEEQEDEIIPKILKQLEYPMELRGGRPMLIPYDAKVGWNKGEYNEKTNPDGLRDWKPTDGGRERSKEVHLLDRKLR